MADRFTRWARSMRKPAVLLMPVVPAGVQSLYSCNDYITWMPTSTEDDLGPFDSTPVKVPKRRYSRTPGKRQSSASALAIRYYHSVAVVQGFALTIHEE